MSGKDIEKEMRKIFVGLAAALSILIGNCIPAAADFHTETRESVAVVETCLETDGGMADLGWGTGFFVGKSRENPSYLVTNYHVIESFLEYGAGEWSTYQTDSEDYLTGKSKIRIYFDAEDYEEAYLLSYDEIKDVALLKLDSATEKRKPLTLLSPADEMVGSTVYAVGYPGIGDNFLVDSTSVWGEEDASVTSGTISRIVTSAGSGRVNIQIDCVIRSGNSGGPLVNEDGAVIGITTWSVTNTETEENINYAVSIDEVIPMLKQHNVDYEMYTGTSGAAIKNRLPYALLIGIGCVVILAAVIAVSVILFVRKKHREKEERQRQIEKENMDTSKAVRREYVPYVRSMSVQHSGMRAEISGQIVIGRSGMDCSLVFDSRTPGVSSRHCSLTWDSSSRDFILMDLNSTYGTYLENGQKLKPGEVYYLRSGDSFYLGSPENTLSVEVDEKIN